VGGRGLEQDRLGQEKDRTVQEQEARGQKLDRLVQEQEGQDYTVKTARLVYHLNMEVTLLQSNPCGICQ
jgi:hypothetical protein